MPPSPLPFTVNDDFNDPSFDWRMSSALGLRIATSTDIIIFGSFSYSPFHRPLLAMKQVAACTVSSR